MDTIDAAVELANASEYSMTSAVWTKDVNAAFDVSARIHACEWHTDTSPGCATDQAQIALSSTDPPCTPNGCGLWEGLGALAVCSPEERN